MIQIWERKIKRNKKKIKKKMIKQNVKILNDQFIKELIESDFLFSKSSIKNKNLKYLNSSIDYQEKAKKEFHILNIFQLNTSLKQYIRILQFLKKSEKFCIYIICQDRHYFNLTKKLATKLFLGDYITVSERFPEIYSHKNITKFVFVLGDVELNNNFYTKVYEEKAFLVNKYNLQLETKLHGFYKIQNALDDYKKLVLLLVLMNKIIITTEEFKNKIKESRRSRYKRMLIQKELNKKKLKQKNLILVKDEVKEEVKKKIKVNQIKNSRMMKYKNVYDLF